MSACGRVIVIVCGTPAGALPVTICWSRTPPAPYASRIPGATLSSPIRAIETEETARAKAARSQTDDEFQNVSPAWAKPRRPVEASEVAAEVTAWAGPTTERVTPG